MTNVWVLWYTNSEKNESGVMRAYDSEKRAQFDLDLINATGDGKSFYLDEVPVYSLDEPS